MFNRRSVMIGGIGAAFGLLTAACGVPASPATTLAITPTGVPRPPDSTRSGATPPSVSATTVSAAPKTESTSAGAAGGVLRVAGAFLPAGLDPAVGTQGFSISWSGLGETLMRVTPAGAVAPWLAESIESIAPTRWRLRLRPGTNFSNGKPVDAVAVKASLARTMEKHAGARSLLQIASMEATDARTLVLETTAPNGGLPANLTSSLTIIHDADEAARLGDDVFGRAPVLTGPFKVSAFQPRESLTVVRQQAYWGGTPALERAELKNVADGNARIAALLAGDVEIARNIPPQGVAQVKAANLAVTSVSGANTYHIFLNSRRPPLDDLAVRRAIAQPVDRQALADRVLGGGEVARGIWPAYLPFAGDTPLPHDSAMARQLLDAANWRPGTDGIRLKDGKRLEFPLLTYPQRPELGLLATAIQAMLKAVGVATTIQNVEDITKPVNSGDYSAAMYSLQNAPTGDPSYILNLLYKSGGDWNTQIGHTSPRLDNVIDRLTSELDPARRIALAREAQAIIDDEAPVVYLMQPPYHTAYTPRIRGLEPHPVESYLLTHALAVGGS